LESDFAFGTRFVFLADTLSLCPEYRW